MEYTQLTEDDLLRLTRQRLAAIEQEHYSNALAVKQATAMADASPDEDSAKAYLTDAATFEANMAVLEKQHECVRGEIGKMEEAISVGKKQGDAPPS